MPGSAQAPARRKSARRVTGRPTQGFHRLAGEQSAGPARRSSARPRNRGGDHVVLGVLELLRLPQPLPQPAPLSWRHHAQPDVAVLARVDRVGVLVFRASAPPSGGGCPQRPDRAPRMPDRAPSRPHRTGRSRCNRLCHNVIGCNRRPAQTRRPERRQWLRRSRPAAIPVSPWWARPRQRARQRVQHRIGRPPRRRAARAGRSR